MAIHNAEGALLHGSVPLDNQPGVRDRRLGMRSPYVQDAFNLDEDAPEPDIGEPPF
jgi:hypothetical protein